MVSFCGCLIAVVACLQIVYGQYNGGYQRRYYVYRRPVGLYPSNSDVRRTYVSTSSSSIPTPNTPNSDAQKLKLDVYYETDCPDSMRFITRQLYPLYQDMSDILDVRLVPYGKAHEYYNSASRKYDFSCHHGPSECYGNTVQSCAISMYPDVKEHLNFINCMENYPRPSQNAKKCARRLSMDWEKIEKCVKGDEGNRLLHENAQRTEGLNPRLYFVPWIVVDETFSETNQGQSLRNLLSVVCNSYRGSHPKCQRYY